MNAKQKDELKERLVDLYIKQGKSAPQIAKIYYCKTYTVRRWLSWLNVPKKLKKIAIDKEGLLKLYQKEKKSCNEIASIYNCTPSAIRYKLIRCGIERRSLSQARNKYPKNNFSGDLVEKSYLIGFRIGDLRVFQTTAKAETVVATCHTTCDPQVLLVRELFEKYGKVTISCHPRNRSFYINCYLNRSFSFLLPKKDYIEEWILRKNNYFKAFVAGYIDAEGNFILNQGRARFKIDSYEKKILGQIKQKLGSFGLNVKLRLIYHSGQEVNPGSGYKLKKDLWRLNINEGRSLLRFISFLEPHLKHYKRVQDMKECKSNIEKRIKKGTI